MKFIRSCTLRTIIRCASLVVACLILGSALARPALATPAAGIRLGVFSPTEKGGTAPGIDIFAGYDFSRNFSLAIDIGFFKQSDSRFNHHDFYVMPVSLLLKAKIDAGMVQPYISGGAGLLNAEIKEGIEFEDSASFQYQLGAGVDIRQFEIDAKYMSARSSFDDYGSFDSGG